MDDENVELARRETRWPESNLPKPDKYDTSQIIAFLQQVVMHKGFYDHDLEFAHLENIQIVCSMAPASTPASKSCWASAPRWERLSRSSRTYLSAGSSVSGCGRGGSVSCELRRASW